MSRQRLLLAGLLALLLAVGYWTRAAAPLPPAAPGSPVPAAGASRPSPASPAAAPAARSRPARNIFEYSNARPPAAEASPTTPTPELTPASPVSRATPEPPVRLVALLRRAGRLLAALSVRGEVAVVGPGDSVGGYRVVAIDEDSGVRLTGPDGAEESLRP